MRHIKLKAECKQEPNKFAKRYILINLLGCLIFLSVTLMGIATAIETRWWTNNKWWTFVGLVMWIEISFLMHGKEHIKYLIVIRFVILVVFIIKLDWSVCICLTQLYDGKHMYRIYYIKNNYMFRHFILAIYRLKMANVKCRNMYLFFM